MYGRFHLLTTLKCANHATFLITTELINLRSRLCLLIYGNKRTISLVENGNKKNTISLIDNGKKGHFIRQYCILLGGKSLKKN